MLSHLESGVLLVVGTLLLIATAPLVLELFLVSVAALFPRSAARGSAAYSPIHKLMVIIPSHDEEGSIGACVDSIARSAHGAENILVIAHNCIDGTADRARAAGAQVSVLNDVNLPGKGNALTHGFDLAFRHYAADAVLVIDADSRVSGELVPAIASSLGRSLVVQGRYEERSASNTPGARIHAFSFLCKNVLRATGRQRLGLSCGIFGNGFAFRRETLDRVPYAAHSIVEDLEFHLSLVAAGIRTEFVPEALVYAEVPASSQGIKTQSARWEGGRIQMLASRGPFLLRQFLGGRPLLAEPLLDLAGLPIAIEVVGLLLLLLIPVPFFRWCGFFGMLTIVLHLAAGLRLSPDPAATARALVQAPFYIVKKLTSTRSVFHKARNSAEWVKTSRAGASNPNGEL